MRDLNQCGAIKAKRYKSLWSFGVFFERAGAGGLFLNRFRFEPLLAEQAALPPAIWQIEQLPTLSRAGDADRARISALLGDLLRRVVAYELTVLAAQGLAYREARLARWSRSKLGLPAARWRLHGRTWLRKST